MTADDRNAAIIYPYQKNRTSMTSGALTIPALVIVLLLSAGCMQQGAVTPPVTVPVAASPPATLVPITPDTPGTPVPVFSPAVAAGTTATTAAPTLPAEVQPVGGFRSFQDPDYSLEYPASWQTNESTLILPEFVHTRHGCMVTSYYQIYQRLRFFYSPDGNALIYSSIVDTSVDVWPRDINGQIVYADIVNAILGDPAHCAGTPVQVFTISAAGFTRVEGIPYEVTWFDFGKINSIGYADGAGTAYIVTGLHKHGVFVFYAANKSAGAWGNARTNMFNTLKLNTHF
jgi:hypothetical protein